ncbi:MAG: hypothetical protein JRE43_03930 [Deltaproteobacteria bacterium]|jgi:hypothetical protein|nr:hypothetical protein [Deltaproteobacteria bacterium]MBW2542072.1 hypothetical protein [Deltaproteobacteria bacterium]
MELSNYQIIWIVSGSILVIGWLVISFTPPSRSRTVIEWLSTTAMYAAILTIFVSLMLRAHAAGYVFAAWAVGLLCVLFGGGMLVSAWKTVAAFGGDKKAQGSATN